MWGQLTGVRALQRWKYKMALIQAQTQSVFEAETAGSFKGHDLIKVAVSLDETAAKEQNARWKMEHADAYCLLRDHHYGRASRRWLLARALRTSMDQAYAEWCSFVRENQVIVPTISDLPAEDIKTLGNTPYQKILPV